MGKEKPSIPRLGKVVFKVPHKSVIVAMTKLRNRVKLLNMFGNQ